MHFRISAVLTALLLALMFTATSSAAAEEAPLLVQAPTMSKTQIVFAYGGYLWSVPRQGGEARQLTTGGHERGPKFSPDGNWIAFTGQYDGNVDAYVMPADGGEPKRLTWHPDPDVVDGWTPDGKKILIRSPREAYADIDRLYTVPVEGGVPEVLPMWRGEAASYSPDALRIAYVPNLKWQVAWKRYHGGQTTPVYLLRLSDLQLEKVTRENSNDDDLRAGRLFERRHSAVNRLRKRIATHGFESRFRPGRIRGLGEVDRALKPIGLGRALGRKTLRDAVVDVAFGG